MKKTTVLFLLICASCLLPQASEAQFFKKLFGGKEEETTKKKVVKKPVATSADKKKADKDETGKLPATIKKRRYRVEVLLPLYYNELVAGGRKKFQGVYPAKALAGVHLYQGLKLAADTLNPEIYKIDLHIQDVHAEETLNAASIKRLNLDSADLIIGAVPSAQINTLADFAKNQHINFVSVLSPSDAGVKDNLFFTLGQPTLTTHCQYIAKLIDKGFPKKTITLYHRSSVAAEQEAWQYFKDADWDEVQTVDCNATPTRDYLSKKFSATELNVVVMPILDPKYAIQLLSQLETSFPDYSFEVYGMPSWQNIAELRSKDHFRKISVNITFPFYFNNISATAVAMETAYYNQFGGKPDEWVYRGYELLSWYADLLMKHGTVFNKKYDDNSGAPFTAYDVKQKKDEEGKPIFYENKHLYLLRYTNGSFTVDE